MKKYLLFILLLCELASCKVSQVPAYNADIINQVSTVAKASDKLMLQIADEDGDARKYSAFKERYIDIQVELNDLLRREQSRAKAEKLVTITSNIIEQFIKYKDRHKTEDAAIKDAVLDLQRDYLNDHFETLLLAERALL